MRKWPSSVSSRQVEKETEYWELELIKLRAEAEQLGALLCWEEQGAKGLRYELDKLVFHW